jgi:flagellar basal-body rod modification protein FlgD
MSTIDAAAATATPPTTTSGVTISNPTSDLSKDQFLQLMVTQLQYQDPTSPTDTSDYLTQLAQFTSVEQETNTAQNTQSSETLALLGHTVAYNASDGSVQSGTVNGVDLTGSSPSITVGTTSGIDLTQLSSVT